MGSEARVRSKSSSVLSSNWMFSGNLWHFEYADDMILASHDLDTLQNALDLLAQEGRSLGLVIHP